MVTSTTITRIGNSRGVRIPSIILEALNLKESDFVDIEVRDGKIIIVPANKVRSGWAEAFKMMHENGDDKLIDMPDLENDTW
jgi:antitoxin MazE